MKSRLSDLSEIEREEFEERAAILEFDAKMSRKKAEETALNQIMEKRNAL